MQPNYLILLEDALRYDAYYSLAMSPVRKLMEPSTEFMQWYSVGNCSDPNLASMLTGLYPWEHHLRWMGKDLKVPTVLLDMQDIGYTTIFAGWPRIWINRDCHMIWQFYTPGHIAENRAPTSDRARELIAQADQPWVCFIRHMWCHAKYVNNNYWDSVRATADDLVVLLDWIKLNYPTTIIILTSDHGEMLPSDKDNIDADKVPPQHAWGLFDPQIHVPMVVYDPSRSPRLDHHYHQHVDLPDIFFGRWPPKPREWCLFESTGVDKPYHKWYHRAVIHDGWKFVVGGDRSESEERFLVPVGDEHENLASRNMAIVAHLIDHLPPAIDYTPEEEEAIAAHLEGLGYSD